MFKKRSTPVDVKNLQWDSKTVDDFTKSDRFEVRITSLTKLSSMGRMTPDKPPMEPVSYEMSGVITRPRLILVNVTFEEKPWPQYEKDFGGWFYNLYNPDNVAFLELWLSDPEGAIRQRLYEAHKSAIYAGRLYSLVRFWKRRGDGSMTAKDQEEGWSYESRYPLIGVQTWVELESPKLPNWAAPFAGGSQRFSIDNLPEHPWHADALLSPPSLPSGGGTSGMSADLHALVFWVAVVFAVFGLVFAVCGLVFSWWPVVVIAGFVAYLFRGDGWGRIKQKP